MRPAKGWPFLVGAGRRRDYSVLLAPDFLVARGEYGLLNEIVTPTAVDGPPRVVEATTGGGRVGIAYVTRLVTAADVANPRDEHSRPLRVIYGFVCQDGRIDEPAGADLDAARTAALDVYRRFLDGEAHFAAVPSAPFPLESTVTAQAPSAPAGRRASPDPVPIRPRPPVWAWGAAAVAAVAAVAVTALLVANTGTEPGQDKPPTPSPSVSTARPSTSD